MKPVIGITSSYLDERTLQTSYDNVDSIVKAGGIPLVFPNITKVEDIDTYVSQFDGLLVTGGGDIDPTLFKEEPHQKLGLIHPNRDEFETILIRKCMEQDKAILAICRGCQILNIACGGDMYQDIYSQIDKRLLQHSQQAPRSHASHYINVSKGSLLHKITDLSSYKVNSYHHQANREMAANLKVSARASDQVIEAIEGTDHSFVVGVQWHPECMTGTEDLPSVKLFTAFIEASKKGLTKTKLDE
ncbi:gamma-glutamyl-gamma-aminobutyrate hydrolase [Salipaludibacillus keqinensis]|uniref:Gamma-glutamyl-gamma-aminobutyrate hydrolase n=2 Tax=Salipaludibacillus keqinensis TaxID=2045207 RepID=A0A323TIA9_9BACI|nr:gamma-glutamyl-gamma-aminobutyrate hydrolase family protein [Salipaludibacillus keqinensis]PYZ92383.1 gamma-glutamyl-gamma-aminobutyrate hydrolase [Salipaludibacillus keqinensis]